jgi:hypothetical protein
VQNVENDDVVLIQIALVRARSECQDELEVCELVQVHNERGLRCELARTWSLEADRHGSVQSAPTPSSPEDAPTPPSLR